jgi:molybdenum storage protein
MTMDTRPHLQSMLMRESLVDKDVIRSTARGTVVRMLPDVHVVKIGGSSIVDHGATRVLPIIDVLQRILQTERIIVGAGGGARSRHVYSIGLDLGMPTGILAELSSADAYGNANILGTLLAPYGVVAIPPEMFGHLLPLFIQTARGVVFSGMPPYKLWEHPPTAGRIPPHRTDSGCFLVAEGFGCKSLTLVKDVDGVFTEDPKTHPAAEFIPAATVSELRDRRLSTLPFDPALLDLLETAHLVERFQVVNGTRPELLERAVRGDHVGTIVYRDDAGNRSQ